MRGLPLLLGVGSTVATVSAFAADELAGALVGIVGYLTLLVTATIEEWQTNGGSLRLRTGDAQLDAADVDSRRHAA